MTSAKSSSGMPAGQDCTAFLLGGGAMGDLIRAHDWSGTTLGPPASWPSALRTVVPMVFNSRHPMCILWGAAKDHCFCNDGFRHALGARDRSGFGGPGFGVLDEIGTSVAAHIDRVMAGDTDAWRENIVVPLPSDGGHGQGSRACSCSPVHDASAASGVGGVLIIFTETTEADERRFRLTQEAGHVGTFELDPVTGELEVSDEFCRLFGLEPRRSYASDEVLALMTPGSGPVEAMSAAPDASNPVGSAEYQIRRPSDGALRWISRRGEAVSDGGRVRLVGVVQDITDRRRIEDAMRQSESQFRTLAQAMPCQVWTGRPDGGLDWFNEMVYKYGGLTEDQLVGNGWTALVHPDDLPAAGERWGAALVSAETYETEFRLRRFDGVYRWHLARAAPIRDAQGAVTRWIGTNTDIDDQKATAQALSDLNRTLEHQVQTRTAELMVAEQALRQSQKMDAVGQLTGGIAHDFNNMLAVVVGSLDLLTRRLAPDDARAIRYVTAAMDGARRAALLTQRLLAFSRQQPLEPEVVDVNRLVAGMSDLVAHSLGGDVRLESVLAAGLWRVHADPNQLENVILNLGVNGRDAMPEGGRLTIETENARLDTRYANEHGVPAGQYVMIAVTDTGTGMPQHVIAKAFDPFFTTKDIGKGTGLGLSQVYGFVKQSGGHVKIYSEPGQGTTVKIYLPRLVGAEARLAVDAGDQEPARGHVDDLILVVEDEAAVRQFSVDALTELGYRVLEADGAAAALRILDARSDVVLLFTDMMMPDTNGRKLAEEAVRRRPGLRVLFTTGYTSNAVVHNGILEAGVAMIGKPFTLADLAAKVREVLDGAD